MKVKKTLIFPFEQQAPYTTTSRQSLLRMAASWLETTMRALKESKKQEESLKITRHKENAFNRSRMIRNCPVRHHHLERRVFSASSHRHRLNAASSRFRAGRYHW